MILRRSRTPLLLPCVLLSCLLSSCGGENAADAGTAATLSQSATVTVVPPRHGANRDAGVHGNGERQYRSSIPAQPRAR